MADYGRYGSETYRSRESSRYGERDRGRDNDSIFGSGWSDRDRDQDRNRFSNKDRDNRSGGWMGSGRTSDYDNDRHQGRGGRGYGSDDAREGLPVDETNRLIASNKVEGTSVYNRDGDKLGSIYNFMVDKRSGKVEYAVMSYGGFLGLGQRYYPLPWRILTYDTRQGGYVVDMSERDLENAPSFSRDNEPRFNEEYGRRVHGWYGLNY